MPASRYEQLCRTFAQTRVEWQEFRQDSMKVCEQVLRGFIGFLQVPDGMWRVLPPNVTPETIDLPYDMASSVKLTEEGAWIYILQITLAAPNGGPAVQQPLLLPIKVSKHKAEGREYEICIADKTCHTLNPGLPSECQALFEAAFELIQEEMDKQVEHFLEDSKTLAPKKIGFY